MADDKKNIPEAAPPAEAPAATVENAAVPEQPAPEPALTDLADFEAAESRNSLRPPCPSWRGREQREKRQGYLRLGFVYHRQYFEEA